MRLNGLTRALFVFVLAAPLAAGSSTASTPAHQAADPPGYRIVSPSGNINCSAIVDGPRDGTMRCYLNRSAKVIARPASAECDWEGGRLFSLMATREGWRASWCDALPVSAPAMRLAYGRVWHRGPFSCLSSRLALLCTNADGHGLLLSYEQQRAF
jgi:hypothetical protein